jgi:WD40 repeat protein
MLHRIIQLAAIIILCSCAIGAQTQSGCEPSPAMSPTAKPGVGGLTLSRDGKTLLVATGDGKIRFVDLNTGEVKRTLTGHTNMVYVATFSPDEKLLASSSRDRTARIWDVASGKESQTFGGFRCSVKAVAFTPDGRTLAASGNDGMLKLWDVKTGKELKSLIHRDSPDIDMATYAFVFSPDSKQIYAANGDGTISVWDVATGKETRNWKAHEGYVFRLLLSPDQRRLISYGDAVVKVWDISGRELQTLALPTTPGASVFSSMIAISDNGKLIAASDAEFDPKQNTYIAVNTVVWNAQTGARLFTLTGHKFDVNGLIFTRDNRFLLTGSVDQTIKFRDMRTGQTTRAITLK